MSKICDVCGLPEELCVCEEIAREVQTVKVFTVRRRFGKLMTIIEGIDEHDIDIKELTKTLKAKCACGGTSKNGQIELQGDHKVRVKEVLSDMGFSSDTIEIRESKKNNKKRKSSGESRCKKNSNEVCEARDCRNRSQCDKH